ncbi:MAG: hypothetical protein Ct9H300mP2_5380 [Candidatus Neomarinimicrobiota bacterium]|nr:MAG: hypothetical protein Ct9H300mP2_5380 [Candidatus Neomarinimicrobiota bacterium]
MRLILNISSYDRFKITIKKHSGKEIKGYTSQRQAVWNELESPEKHRDAKSIYFCLGGKKFEYPGRPGLPNHRYFS